MKMTIVSKIYNILRVKLYRRLITDSFCCECSEKMWSLTSPDAPVGTTFCGKCVVCDFEECYSYHVPESLWRVIVPELLWNEIICAKCFHEFAVIKNKK